MTVNKFLLPILTFVALFGAVFYAKSTGDWAISGRQNINIDDMSSTEDIRGWMTLQQVIDSFDIPKGILYRQLNIPIDIPTQTPLKELEGLVPGFEVSAVRQVVDDYLSGALPEIEHVPQGEPEEGGPIPPPPGEILPGSDIRGGHTLQEISSQCQIPYSDLIYALGLPQDIDRNTKAKDLVGIGNVISIQVIREAVTALQSSQTP